MLTVHALNWIFSAVTKARTGKNKNNIIRWDSWRNERNTEHERSKRSDCSSRKWTETKKKNETGRAGHGRVRKATGMGNKKEKCVSTRETCSAFLNSMNECKMLAYTRVTCFHFSDAPFQFLHKCLFLPCYNVRSMHMRLNFVPNM